MLNDCIASYGQQLEYAAVFGMPQHCVKRMREACTEAKLGLKVSSIDAFIYSLKILAPVLVDLITRGNKYGVIPGMDHR